MISAWARPTFAAVAEQDLARSADRSIGVDEKKLGA